MYFPEPPSRPGQTLEPRIRLYCRVAGPDVTKTEKDVSGSVCVASGYTTASSIYELEEPEVRTGGEAYLDVGGGVETIQGKGYTGYEVKGGLGEGAGVYTQVTETHLAAAAPTLPLEHSLLQRLHRPILQMTKATFGLSCWDYCRGEAEISEHFKANSLLKLVTQNAEPMPESRY